MITAPLAMPSRCVFDGTVPTGGNASRPLAWESATMTIETTTRVLAAVPALPVSDEQGTDEGLGFLRRTRSRSTCGSLAGARLARSAAWRILVVPHRGDGRRRALQALPAQRWSAPKRDLTSVRACLAGTRELVES